MIDALLLMGLSVGLPGLYFIANGQDGNVTGYVIGVMVTSIAWMIGLKTYHEREE